ncbi:MAG TPA: alpha-galactosidase [Phycisphaerae bacterium]|nr:alpha-galactosidase [Phycisphaerae bacterium]
MTKQPGKTAGVKPVGPQNIEISFHKSGERDAARYVSGMTVCQEALQNGRWLGLYWSAGGQVQRENITSTLPILSPTEVPLAAFDLEIDGQRLHNRWTFAGGSERSGGRPGTREAVVELRHEVRPVMVKVVTRVDGTGILARYLEITNTGKAAAALSRVSPWSGLLWAGGTDRMHPEPPRLDEPFSLGAFRGLVQGTEGDFGWSPVQPGWQSIESVNGRSGFGNPFFVLRNNTTGEMAFLSVAWSGNWYADFWRDPALNRSGLPARGVNLAFRAGPQAVAPQRVIEPGETIRSPETHLGILHGSFDECVHEWHRHVRTSVIPPRPKGKEFFTLAGRVVEEPNEWILREIDIAAEMGVKAFMVDAGWYGDEFAAWPDRRGDWWVGSWMPGGLAGCREQCHQNKMLFGLWMEPETVGSKSRLLAEHPDWMLTTDGDRQLARALDLSLPDAAAFFRDCVLKTIRDHKLDFFKLDYNVDVREGGQRRRGDLVESELWRHYEVLYDVFDQVRSDMPQVALECCASGGGRNDLGMLSRFHYVCESDFSMFPRSIRAINGLTLFIPPESICYYHNHMPLAHQQADLKTHLRVTLFAQPIFVGFGAQDADRSTPYFQQTKRYIRLANEFCGPILAAHPRVYHHTPDIGLRTPADWCVLEYDDADRSRGYAGVFRLTGGAAEYRLRLRGVDMAADYEVTLDNASQTLRVSGRELAVAGLPIELDSALTSELVLYRKVAIS